MSNPNPDPNQEGIVDATMLAKAGLNRMNLGHEITAVLEWDTYEKHDPNPNPNLNPNYNPNLNPNLNPNPNPNP